MRALGVVLVLALAAGPLVAAEADPQATFQALELKIMSAVAGNDVEALETLVAPGFAWALAFEGRSNAIMNRSEWIKGGQYVDLRSFDISRLVAETFDDLALVHFRLTGEARLGESSEMSGGYVVTDLWQREGKQWKLLRRFMSSPAPLPKKR
jgi:hypothetical protein